MTLRHRDRARPSPTAAWPGEVRLNRIPLWGLDGLQQALQPYTCVAARVFQAPLDVPRDLVDLTSDSRFEADATLQGDAVRAPLTRSSRRHATGRLGG